MVYVRILCFSVILHAEKIQYVIIMHKLITILKDFTLPAGMTCGLAGFLAFHYVRWLAPVKPAAQAAAEALMPTVLFIMLFATFCKVNPRDMRVRGWHVWLVTFRLLSCLLTALYLHFTPGAPGELLLEGLMLCLVCPTAGAAAVITGRLGGRHGRRNSRLPCDAPPHGGFAGSGLTGGDTRIQRLASRFRPRNGHGGRGLD